MFGFRRIVSLCTVLLMASVIGRAQHASKSTEVTVFFRVNSTVIDLGYFGNAEALQKLDKTIDIFRMNIDSVSIVAYASPEGNFQYNQWLSANRAAAMRKLLVEKYNDVDFKSIKEIVGGPDFAGLTKKIEADPNIPYRDEVLRIVRNWGEDPVATFKALRALRGGKPYSYISYKYLPWLRTATTVIFHYNASVSLYKEPDAKQGESGTDYVLPARNSSVNQTSATEADPLAGLPASSVSSAENRPAGSGASGNVGGTYQIRFAVNSSVINTKSAHNAQAIAAIREALGGAAPAEVIIVSHASPEGPANGNKMLSDRRAEAAMDMFGDLIPSSTKVTYRSEGEAWEGLQGSIESNYNRSDRQQVLDILSSNLSNEQKKQAINKLAPESRKHIVGELSEGLRSVTVTIVPATAGAAGAAGATDGTGAGAGAGVGAGDGTGTGAAGAGVAGAGTGTGDGTGAGTSGAAGAGAAGAGAGASSQSGAAGTGAGAGAATSQSDANGATGAAGAGAAGAASDSQDATAATAATSSSSQSAVAPVASTSAADSLSAVPVAAAAASSAVAAATTTQPSSESQAAPVADSQTGASKDDSHSGAAASDSKTGASKDDSQSGAAASDSKTGASKDDSQSGAAASDSKTGASKDDSKSGAAASDSKESTESSESQSSQSAVSTYKAPADTSAAAAPVATESSVLPIVPVAEPEDAVLSEDVKVEDDDTVASAAGKDKLSVDNRAPKVDTLARAPEAPVLADDINVEDDNAVADSTASEKLLVDNNYQVDTIARASADSTEYIRKPLIAVKTNLLYDLLITPNIGYEIPIGQKFSFFSDYTFPWWLNRSNDRAWQMLKWDIGGRWYFSKHDKEDLLDVLRGHHLGLDLSAGYYDLEPKHKGWQGEFQAVGLEYGYTWRLSERWRLDASIGAGLFATKFRYYKGDSSDVHLIYQNHGKLFYFGPIELGITLKYLFTRKVKKEEQK